MRLDISPPCCSVLPDWCPAARAATARRQDSCDENFPNYFFRKQPALLHRLAGLVSGCAGSDGEAPRFV